MAGEWTRVRVDQIAQRTATGPFGSAISSKYFCDSGVPVIRGSNLSQETGIRLVDEGLTFVSEEKARDFARSEARPGDLVFTCWGTIDQVGLIDHRARYERYIVSNKQMLFTPDASRADSLFLYYTFRSPENRSAILNQGIGSSVPGFNLGQLRSFEIDLPPLAEQKAIAAVLGALDDKIELNRRMNATLEAMARALFQSWFVDFDPVRAKLDGRKPDGLDEATAALFPAAFQESPLGPIPNGWRRWTLREIAEVTSGGTPSKGTAAYWSGTIPWISPKVMTRIHVDDSDDHVSEAAVGNGTRLVPKGTVLVMVRGMGLHQGVRISQAQRDVTFNQDVKALVAKTVPSTFLLYGLLEAAPMLLSKVHASGHGTGVLSTEFLDHLSFTVPPSDALDALSQPLTALNSRIATNDRESRTLAALRDTLLPKLLSGELAVPPALGKVNS